MFVATACIITPARFSRKKPAKIFNAAVLRGRHDRATGEVIHQREKPMQFADTHFVDRQAFQAPQLRPSLPLEPTLVDPGHRVPGQPAGLVHLLNGHTQKPAANEFLKVPEVRLLCAGELRLMPRLRSAG